jgi:hypothetical protein
VWVHHEKPEMREHRDMKRYYLDVETADQDPIQVFEGNDLAQVLSISDMLVNMYTTGIAVGKNELPFD